MRAADSEPGEKPRRNNPSDDNPVPTDDNPSNPSGGGNGGNGSGGGNGRGGHGGGNHGDGGRGGGHHGGDDDPNHRHRGHGHDGDHDRDHDRHHRHRRHHDDNATIYDPNNQSTSSNGAARNVNECDRGYEDGLYTGASDARRGQSHDPQRSHFYKRGGGGLFSIGRSDAAKQEYRDCFLRGYEEGFKNYN